LLQKINGTEEMVQRGITPLVVDWELRSKRLLLLKRGHRTTLTGSLRKMKIQNLEELTENVVVAHKELKSVLVTQEGSDFFLEDCIVG